MAAEDAGVAGGAGLWGTGPRGVVWAGAAGCVATATGCVATAMGCVAPATTGGFLSRLSLAMAATVWSISLSHHTLA
jgi:hypothetical protein